ncbi:MAG TPA: NAD(P)/FAD-dependent oxidoreductase [Kofleriaceae bacterium]
MPSGSVEVVVVGGGPAGLSAALLLGRCRRNVVVYDDGTYRNASAPLMRGFLTRDQMPAREVRRIAHRELQRYPSVSVMPQTVADVKQLDDQFAVLTKDGEELHCRALLLATGFRDTLPTIAGARDLYGELVVPCPYCDAWEVRDQPIAAFSYPDERGAAYASLLSQWSADVIFCAERRPQLGDETRRKLAARNVRVEHRELRSLEREGDGVRLIFSEGETVWRRKLFFHLGDAPASKFAARLGAALDDKGGVDVDRKGQSSVPGLFVAGDATRDVLQAIVAAGEGAAAAVTINEYLCEKELYAKRT